MFRNTSMKRHHRINTIPSASSELATSATHQQFDYIAEFHRKDGLCRVTEPRPRPSTMKLWPINPHPAGNRERNSKCRIGWWMPLFVGIIITLYARKTKPWCSHSGHRLVHVPELPIGWMSARRHSGESHQARKTTHNVRMEAEEK